MEGWKDGRMEGWMDGWMDGLDDVRFYQTLPVPRCSNSKLGKAITQDNQETLNKQKTNSN